MTAPAAETKSIGLPADALAVMVFASPPRHFYLDGSTPARLPGLSHLDNFIVTRKSSPLIGTLQKRMPTPTQTATSHTCRAVKSFNKEESETILTNLNRIKEQSTNLLDLLEPLEIDTKNMSRVELIYGYNRKIKGENYNTTRI